MAAWLIKMSSQFTHIHIYPFSVFISLTVGRGAEPDTTTEVELSNSDSVKHPVGSAQRDYQCVSSTALI